MTVYGVEPMAETPTVRSHLLRVAEIVAETGDAHSVVFELDESQASAFGYTPGQFLTVRVPSDRCGSVARCYSLSSSPFTGDRLQVTVKRTADGYASNWICDNLAAGDQVEVLVPSGVFSPKSLDNDLLLFAGGSGITPVMSIVKSVLAKGSGRITLVYANRDEHSVIFGRELRELAAANPDRLTVIHWLESVQGLPELDQLRALAEPFAERETFVCGPRPFMSAVSKACKSLGITRERLHTEKFVSLGGNVFENATIVGADPATDSTVDTPAPVVVSTVESPDAPADDAAPATVSVDLDGTEHEFAWPRRTKLLDLLLEKGLDAPFSCREGQCSACACRITAGEVKMLNNEILDSEDLDEGIVLACQSVPITDDVSVSYE